MSIAQFISYSTVPFINDFWKELGNQAQFFYDRGKDTFVFRTQYQVIITNKNNLSKITRIRIPYEGPILSMIAHIEHKFVVYQIDQSQINIFSCRLNKHSIFRLPKSDKPQAILHYEWIYQVKGSVDFIIVESNGVHLFKIDDDKSGIKEVKFVSQKVSCCWFEPKNETLITTNYLQPGVMQTYYFSEKRKDFKYKGPDFMLEEDPSLKAPKSSSLSNLFGQSRQSKNSASFQNQSFVPPGDNKNMDLSIANQSIDHPHRIYVTNLYGKTYLLYSNSFTGKIIFYLLTYDKIVKQPFVLAFPSDIMINLSIFDNLIVLSAIIERISIVFDIKKQKPDSPIGPPQPIETEQQSAQIQVFPPQMHQAVSKIEQKQEQQEEQEQEQQQEQDQEFHDAEEPKPSEAEGYNFLQQSMFPSQVIVPAPQSEQTAVQFGFDFEGLFAELRESDKEKRLRDQFVVKMKWTVRPLVGDSQILRENDVVKPSQIYEKQCNYLEDEFIVDPVNKQLFQFQLNLAQLPRLLEDELESFLALLRRNHCKQGVFEFLRDLVHRNKQIMIFSLLYKHVFEIFSRAIHERNQKQEQTQNVEPASDKLKNGYTILYPADFLQHFFQPLSDHNSKVNRTYVVELLVEFIRQFIDNLKDHRVQVPSQIQNLLIKLLVKDNRMPYVHFLLQYQILSDSVDFAKLLIEISSKETLEAKNLLGKYQVYEPAFQMGIDMLHRMQKYEDMLEVFLRRGMFSETAYLLRKYGQTINTKIRIQQVIEGQSKAGCIYTQQEVLSLFEDIQRKTKGERLGFTTEELKTLLAN